MKLLNRSLHEIKLFFLRELIILELGCPNLLCHRVLERVVEGERRVRWFKERLAINMNRNLINTTNNNMIAQIKIWGESNWGRSLVICSTCITNLTKINWVMWSRGGVHWSKLGPDRLKLVGPEDWKPSFLPVRSEFRPDRSKVVFDIKNQLRNGRF